MKSNKDIIIVCLVTTFIIILTCCIIAYFLPDKNNNWFISITTSLLCGIIVSLLLAIRAYIEIRNRLTRELYNAIIDVAYSIYPIKQYASHCLEKDNINSLLLSRDVPGSIQKLQRYVESVGTIFSKYRMSNYIPFGKNPTSVLFTEMHTSQPKESHKKYNLKVSPQ